MGNDIISNKNWKLIADIFRDLFNIHFYSTIELWGYDTRPMKTGNKLSRYGIRFVYDKYDKYSEVYYHKHKLLYINCDKVYFMLSDNNIEHLEKNQILLDNGNFYLLARECSTNTLNTISRYYLPRLIVDDYLDTSDIHIYCGILLGRYNYGNVIELQMNKNLKDPFSIFCDYKQLKKIHKDVDILRYFKDSTIICNFHNYYRITYDYKILITIYSGEENYIYTSDMIVYGDCKTLASKKQQVAAKRTTVVVNPKHEYFNEYYDYSIFTKPYVNLVDFINDHPKIIYDIRIPGFTICRQKSARKIVT